MRGLWRWLTGRTLKDTVPEYNLEWWNGAVEYENIDLGSHVIGPEGLQSVSDLSGRPLGTVAAAQAARQRIRDREAGVSVVDHPLNDDFRERVVAHRAGLADLISTLHDSTMMARIDKGVQPENDIPHYWVDLGQTFPRAVPHTIDPYLWHDVADLIDRARAV